MFDLKDFQSIKAVVLNGEIGFDAIEWSCIASADLWPQSEVVN